MVPPTSSSANPDRNVPIAARAVRVPAMSAVLRVSVLAAIAVASADAPARAADKPEPGRKAAELQWAAGVASDFLTCVIEIDGVNAPLLLSAEFRKQFATAAELENWLSRAANENLRKGFEITTRELAPDQDDALFRGTLSGEKKTAGFTLRLTKEKDGGKWRVTYFVFKLVEEPKP